MQTHEPLPDGIRLSSKRVDALTHRKSLAEMLCDFWPATEHAWPSLEKALIEVDEALGADRDRIAQSHRHAARPVIFASNPEPV